MILINWLRQVRHQSFSWEAPDSKIIEKPGGWWESHAQ